MLAAETRNPWRKYQRSENEEQLHAHCISFKFCAKVFRPNKVLDVPVAWEELPFGKCEVVPGQVDQSKTNDWESFLISFGYMNSFMYASKLVPWKILIRARENT